MTKMISLIIVVLFFFVMVLCAIQPICFPNATELEYNHRLSIVDTEINANEFHLMLDPETPLTLRFFKDNPDYFINIVSSDNGFSVQCDDHTSTTSIFNVGASAGVEYRLCYDNISAWVWVYEQEEIILDSPLYVSHVVFNEKEQDTTYMVYSAWNYQVPLLEKMAVLGSHLLTNAQTVVNFIVKTPLMLITFGLSLLAFVFTITKRFIQVG